MIKHAGWIDHVTVLCQASFSVSGWSFGMPRGSTSGIGCTMHNKAAASMQNLTALKRAEQSRMQAVLWTYPNRWNSQTAYFAAKYCPQSHKKLLFTDCKYGNPARLTVSLHPVTQQGYFSIVQQGSSVNPRTSPDAVIFWRHT